MQFLISVIDDAIGNRDRKAARTLAADGSKACNRTVELRPLLGA